MKRNFVRFIVLCAILFVNFLFLKSFILDASWLAFPARAEAAPVSSKTEAVKDWLISVAPFNSGYSIIDPQTRQVYGPFLTGLTGITEGDALDVAVSPEGKIALISNVLDRAVTIIDISDPFDPGLKRLISTPIDPADIDLSSDGKFALVANWSGCEIITIDIPARALAHINSICPYQAQAVAIAPDNTVITSDPLRGGIQSHLLLPTGEITHTIPYTNPYAPGINPEPVNVGIAPDGHTVVVVSGKFDVAQVYRITAPGVLTFTGTITGLPTGGQSVAFNEVGDKAFILSSDGDNSDKLSVLDILGPGQVHLNTAGAAALFSKTKDYYYGVDMLAVYDGYAFAGSPVYVSSAPTMTVVNLTDFITTPLLTGDYPFGIDVIYAQRPLTVQKTGSGTGSVQSSVSGIDCGSTCTANFNHNDFGSNKVTLTTVADPSSSFVGWSGDCSGTGACAVDLTEPRAYTVTAEFSHSDQWIPFVAFLGEVTTNTLR